MLSSKRADRFVEFVAARRPHMLRYAYLLCGDWHRAEDLVQTAFVKLYVAWNRVAREEAEEAYVRRIILRCYLDERRRPWRREHTVAEPPDIVVDTAMSYEDLDRVRRAVRELPARQRVALVLRYWSGLSIEETAHDLGCSAGTVRSHTSRAIEKLRGALATADLDADN